MDKKEIFSKNYNTLFSQQYFSSFFHLDTPIKSKSLLKRDIPEISASTTLLYIYICIPYTSFPFLFLITSHFSYFLFPTENNPSPLVKSLMKLDTLDDALPWPSTQMVTVKTNNSCHHHLTSIYFSPFFSFYLFSFDRFTHLFIYHNFIASVICLPGMGVGVRSMPTGSFVRGVWFSPVNPKETSLMIHPDASISSIAEL